MMAPMLSEELVYYFNRVAMPTVLFIGFIMLAPRHLKLLRILAFILLFVLLRDAMTPSGLWKITPSFDIRFISQPLTLNILGITSIMLVVLSHFVLGSLLDIKLWIARSVMKSSIAGALAGCIIAFLPFIYRWVTKGPYLNRPEGNALIFSIFSLSMLGNLLEETLFRGHLQSHLYVLGISKSRVILLSGATFCLCHTFLAYTVTDLGLSILTFTFYEGIICAYLRAKEGLLSAAIAHGLGLFLIGSGLF